MSEGRRVIVAGGNIAGLGVGLALTKYGLDPIVIERMSDLPDVGGGLHIWTNGAKALAWLGVAGTLRGAGVAVEQLEFRTRRGKRLMTAPLGEFARRHGHGAFFVRRAALPRTLLETFGRDRVEFGSELVGYEHDASGVTAHLADGRELRGRLLVGADGRGSTVRSQLVGDATPIYAGYQDWGAVVATDEVEVPHGHFWTVFGRGARAGIAHVGPGLVYWAVSIQRPRGAPPPTLDELRGRFADWPEALSRLIELTPPGALFGGDISEVPKLPTWIGPRVALLGDAAHAMEPGAGRGASEGLVDAVTLAHTLASLDSLEDETTLAAALRRWQRRRRRATRPVVNRSRQIGQLSKWDGRLAIRARALYIQSIRRFVVRSMERDFRQPLLD